jgi:hypothetical protein
MVKVDIKPVDIKPGGQIRFRRLGKNDLFLPIHPLEKRK